MLSASTDLGINNTQEHRINTVFIISLKWDIENHEIRWLCMKLNKLIVCQHCSTDLRSAVALLTLRTRSPVSRNHILNVTIECCIIHDYTCNLLEGKNVWKKMQNYWKYHHKTYNKFFISNIFVLLFHGKLR